MILVTKWFGVFLCDDQKVRRHLLFEKDPKTIAHKLAAIQRGEILEEEERLAQKRMRVAEPRLSKLGKPEVFDSSFIKAEDYSYSMHLMQKVMVELGKIRTREPLSPDKFIVQSVRAMDDLIEMINLMSERLHEWYGLHFPELADYASEEKYARLIAEKGSREVILSTLDLQLESVGSDILEEDAEVVQGFASGLLALYEEKRRLEEFVAHRMQEVAPNLSALVGPSIGARLISLAGGLGRLARLPSSTVQLLGAEKAMFLHLRSGKKPPKHGVIFQLPAIHKAPYWQRGNISRSLAGKLSIAAKVDYWKGDFLGDKLLKEFEERILEIEKKYPEPPKREKRPERGRGRDKHRGRNKGRR